jgi:hypothetical protein
MAKKRDDELLDKPNFLRVISKLEQEKPITKKAACEMLNITYNTTRLGKLITEFKDNEAVSKKMRAKLKGVPLTSPELLTIAESYLNGVAVSEISEFTYRSTLAIKKVIKELNIPERNASSTYQTPPLIDFYAIKKDYEYDDLVYAARYGEAALIEKKIDTKDGPAYTIYVLGKEQCYATQPFWELADLTRLQKDLKLEIKPLPGLPPSYNPK